MQTVNFQCGHCNNVMAVADTYLGQQVRCPHCQQVVVAPAAPPQPAPPGADSAAIPVISVPKEQDSIFGPAEIPGDDVFGAPPPRLEIPAGPSWMQPQAAPVAQSPAWMQPEAPAAPQPAPSWMSQAPAVEAPAPVPNMAPDMYLQPTVTVPAAMEALAQSPEQPGGAAFAPQPSPEWGASSTPESPGESLPSEPLIGAGTRTAAYKSRGGGGWFILLVVMPLISYSIVSTIAVITLYFQREALKDQSPLKTLPDIEGDNPGAKRLKPGQNTLFERVNPESPLPTSLKVALHQPFQIGDIEVTGEKVEQRKILFRVGSFNPDPSTGEALVLRLRLRNISKDVVFCPTDRAFDHKWSPKQGGNKPYTFLEVGNRKFFGAADTQGTFNRGRKEMVEGQTFGTELNPGQELTTIVCTDPEDDRVLNTLNQHNGPLLWRVHVRRGLVQVEDKDYSTTAVVGIEFTKRDIQKGG